MSVVLPTLNERGFITDCLESLLNQTYAGITEILVVDGGSSDGTVEIATSRGEPIRVLHNSKVTAAAAMNLGLHAAPARSSSVLTPIRCMRATMSTGASQPFWKRTPTTSAGG